MALWSSDSRKTALFAKVTITKTRYTGTNLFLIYRYYSEHDHLISSLVVTTLRKQTLISNCLAAQPALRAKTEQNITRCPRGRTDLRTPVYAARLTFLWAIACIF